MKRMPTDKVPILMSYAFLRSMSERVVAEFMNTEGVELLLDSGAFTALNQGLEIPLDEYMEFLHKWKHRLFGYIALDKLQDPKRTAANFQVMLSEGLSPIPVHVLGDEQRRMDELFDVAEWVALGGLRRPHRGGASLAYLKQKMLWAKGRRVHWLGYTKEAPMRAMRPFSSDCSSFASGIMYGRVSLYAGAGQWWGFTYKELMDRKLFLRPEIREIIAEYNVTVADLISEAQWHNGNKDHGIKTKDSVIIRLPARSWTRYVLEFKRRYGVRIFIACVPANFFDVTRGYNFCASKGLL